MSAATKRVTARRNPGDPQPCAADTVEAAIAGLVALPVKELWTRWQSLHGVEPPSRLSRDLLARGIACELQKRAFGGLSPAAARRLRSLTGNPDKADAVILPAPALKLGARLVREWHGRTHSVTVVESGFDYEGKRYRSLSEIARRITGVHRSGPLFFGLMRPSSPTPARGSNE